MSSAFSVQTRKMQYHHYNYIITSNYILLSQEKNSQEIDNIKVDFAILIFLVSNLFYSVATRRV
jgi:AAA15 family ATPase/GTPase